MRISDWSSDVCSSDLDHAVSCINCLVDPDTWKAQGQQPEERGHHSVTETFRKALNRSACYACLIQDFRIAADDHGDGGARCGAIPGLQRSTNRGHLIATASLPKYPPRQTPAKNRKRA